MDSFFQTAQILVAILLVAVILIQVRGQGSGFFGSAQASFRTRRGVEKTLFQFTIALAAVFTLLAIVSAIRPSFIF
ncbi:MAG: preprotein translocase subunit SecG [Chloroflexi bacterium]|nr:preprotein translocase subunit SecG [Chloroflexota bacterium]